MEAVAKPTANGTLLTRYVYSKMPIVGTIMPSLGMRQNPLR